MKQPAGVPTFQRATKYPPTRHDRKQDTASGTAAGHLNQPQPTRNVRTHRRATRSHCCRTTKSAPIGIPLRRWRAQKRQQNRHWHVTGNISDAAQCVRVCCRVQSCLAASNEGKKWKNEPHPAFDQKTETFLILGPPAPSPQEQQLDAADGYDTCGWDH